MLQLNVSCLVSFLILGGPDLLVILVIILVLFGAKKLPELARGLGQAIKEFQKAKDEFTDELHKAGHSDDAAKGNPRQHRPLPELTLQQAAPSAPIRTKVPLLAARSIKSEVRAEWHFRSA